MPLQLVSAVLMSNRVQPLPPAQLLLDRSAPFPFSQPGTPPAAPLAAVPCSGCPLRGAEQRQPCLCAFPSGWPVTSSAKFRAGCARCIAGNGPVQDWLCGLGGCRVVEHLGRTWSSLSPPCLQQMLLLSLSPESPLCGSLGANITGKGLKDLGLGGCSRGALHSVSHRELLSAAMSWH